MARAIGITEALLSIRPGATWNLKDTVDYSTLEWLDSVQSKPTENEVNTEIARLNSDAPFVACSNEAKKRIAASDWAVLPDVNISNRAEFESYRATLRALIITPVADPVFPAEPQPVWIA
jgi:hypothetical protein